MATKEKDAVTGTETTGHEWDGIKELNTPLPKWWLYVFYITIVWAVVYMVLYPSFPMGGTYIEGVMGYSQRQEVEQEVKEARSEHSDILNGIAQTEVTKIPDNPDLLNFAIAGGSSAFLDNCAPCHGSGATGGPGYPSLQDDAWLWGGKLEDIHYTLLHGIRHEADPDTRFNQMPAFGRDGLLTQKQVDQVAEYVLSLTDRANDQEAAKAGEVIFNEQCTSCHQEGGVGDMSQGAPALNDNIWLYGGTKHDIIDTVNNSRAGHMPAWQDRLDPETIKMLTVYVHSLGGGQ